MPAPRWVSPPVIAQGARREKREESKLEELRAGEGLTAAEIRSNAKGRASHRKERALAARASPTGEQTIVRVDGGTKNVVNGLSEHESLRKTASELNQVRREKGRRAKPTCGTLVRTKKTACGCKSITKSAIKYST